MSDSEKTFDPGEMSRISRLLGEIESLPPAGIPPHHRPDDADGNGPAVLTPEEAERAIEHALKDVGDLAEFRPTRRETTPDDAGNLLYRIGILSAREAFSLINWHADPEKGQRLRDALYPELAEPPGEEGSVGEVLAGFGWDDDED